MYGWVFLTAVGDCSALLDSAQLGGRDAVILVERIAVAGALETGSASAARQGAIVDSCPYLSSSVEAATSSPPLSGHGGMSLVPCATLESSCCGCSRLEIGRGTAETEERRVGAGRIEACDGSQDGEGANCNSEDIERLGCGIVELVRSVGQDKPSPAHRGRWLFLQLLAWLTILHRYDQGTDGLLSTVIHDIAPTLFPASNSYQSCDQQGGALGVSSDVTTAVVAISQALDLPVPASRAPEGTRAPCYQVPDFSPSAAMSNAALGTDSCVAINSDGASSAFCTTCTS
jgi:hypothetical protein